MLKASLLCQHYARCFSKYILNDYTSDYKTRLLKLQLLPLMYLLDLSDVLFFLLSPSNYHLIISIYYTSYLSAVVTQDPHLTTSLTIIILEPTKFVIHILQDSHVFGILFLQSISINHLVASKHIFTIIYGNILKLILISSILAHFTIHVLVLIATREIKQPILSSHQIQINIYLSIVDRLSYVILGCWHGLPSDPQYLL